jgi:ADP-ribose pyrophosphatase YjhB (NUDIX family)
MTNAAIKVKAMAVFAAEGRTLLMPCFDSVKQKAFLRLLGGHMEFGETSGETLRREMLEELGAEVEILSQIGVVQHVFNFEGRRYHEIVFIHHARFLDEAFNRREDLYNLELPEETFRWIPIAEALGGSVPLYPAADYARFFASIAC